MELIFKIMCIFADLNYQEIDFKESYWFDKYFWTEEQQVTFCDWFEDYIYYNPKVRKELYKYSFKNRKWSKSAAQWFILNYGFKVKKL